MAWTCHLARKCFIVFLHDFVKAGKRLQLYFWESSTLSSLVHHHSGAISVLGLPSSFEMVANTFKAKRIHLPQIFSEDLSMWVLLHFYTSIWSIYICQNCVLPTLRHFCRSMPQIWQGPFLLQLCFNVRNANLWIPSVHSRCRSVAVSCRVDWAILR